MATRKSSSKQYTETKKEFVSILNVIAFFPKIAKRTFSLHLYEPIFRIANNSEKFSIDIEKYLKKNDNEKFPSIPKEYDDFFYYEDDFDDLFSFSYYNNSTLTCYEEYINEYRKLAVSNPETAECYANIIDYIEEHDPEYSDLQDGKALLKLYLNIPLYEEEIDYVIDKILRNGKIDLAKSIREICNDKDFSKNFSDETKIALTKIQDALFLDEEYDPLIPGTSVGSENPSLFSSMANYCRFGLSGINEDQIFVHAFDKFLKGNFEEAKKLLIAYQKEYKKKTGKINKESKVIALINFCRMMTNSEISNMNKQIESQLNKDSDTKFLLTLYMGAIKFLNDLRSGQKTSFSDKVYNCHIYTYFRANLSCRIIILCALACDKDYEITDDIKDQIISAYKQTMISYPFICKAFYNTIKSLTGTDFAPELNNSEYFDFSTIINNDNIWKNQINSIKDILKLKDKKDSTKKKVTATKKATKKLAWIFREFNEDSLQLPTPGVITLDENDNIKSESYFDVKYFYSARGEKADYLTDQDKTIAASHEMLSRYNSTSYSFSCNKTLLSLIGHPYIYLKKFASEEYIHLSAEKKKVSLEVKEDGDFFTINISSGQYGDSEKKFTIDEKNKKLYIYSIEKVHQDLINLLKDSNTKFPKSALDEIVSFGTSTDIEMHYEVNSASKNAQVKPTILLKEDGKYYEVRIRAKASDEENCPYKLPGEGEESILVYQKESGLPVLFKRDLSEEKKNAIEIVDSIPALDNMYKDSDFSYSTDDMSDFLAFLEQCNGIKDKCTLEWAEGRKFYVQGSISPSSFKLKGDLGENAYLSISGDVQLSDERYISLKSLLKSLDTSSGNYIKIDEQTYVSITSDLKKRLEKLNTVTTFDKQGNLISHPLAQNTVETLLDDMNCSFTKKVSSIVEKRNKALEKDFKVPKTLNAQLRSYQIEGFKWLCRMEEWGVGACLADDMGLGKTVQTISAMLAFASKGPIMIAAPTSVCPNWENELNKFAPTLKTHRLKLSEDRESTITSMKSGDVLIVSYGLLSNEAPTLSQIQWQLAVYDEAQALKNSATQRAKTASIINAHMSLALTGTPIENNLDDLWSIFNIINPGLLGSKSDFHKKFANAADDKIANRMLKLLISPFILRRLKGDVLEDLPPRTEQVITVEASQREKELYETLRLSTLEDLEKNKLEINKTGQRRLQILSALTKLRQFCCDPSLLGKELKFKSSSKTDAFKDLLDEALSGGHRLLVFSQFVGYLTIIRNLLEKEGISYQYLDGSTPEKARAKAIDEFQTGIGDVFLISLKAGGQGLNLTGADYVVHLDPWWNPAVEDQATDRAYRIGQTRPVNVFRLVIKDSLEEKILELHAKKREVAADFLEGTANVASEAMKLTEQELLDLLG